MKRRRSIAVLAGLVTLVAAPAAGASSSADKISFRVSSDYIKDGKIDPCKYTTDELQTALTHVSPDLRQYASDYPEAIRAAIEERASGACDTSTGGTTTTPAAPAPTVAAPTPVPTTGGVAVPTTAAVAPTIGEPPSPDTPAVPAAVDTGTEPALDRAAFARPDNVAPAPLIGLGAVLLLLLAGAALLVALRRLGFGEGRFAPAYHSWREARWRAGGVWADFRDWLSLGR